MIIGTEKPESLSDQDLQTEKARMYRVLNEFSEHTRLINETLGKHRRFVQMLGSRPLSSATNNPYILSSIEVAEHEALIKELMDKQRPYQMRFSALFAEQRNRDMVVRSNEIQLNKSKVRDLLRKYA